MTEEEKKALEDAKKQLNIEVEGIASTKAEEIARSIVDKMMSEKNDELMKQFSSKEEYEASRKEFTKQIAEISAEVKKNGQIKKTEKESTTLYEVIKQTITDSKDVIQSFAPQGEEVKMSMKAVGDMTLDGNFPNHTPFTQDVRSNMILTPYNRVWISDLLPTATSTGTSVLFPKENGGEGGAAVWQGSGKKAKMDFDFTSQAAHFKWVAGVVVIDRAMLDDVDWLGSYLAQKMLISLKIAENGLIMEGTTDANPVQGLKPAAKNYDGTFAAGPDRVIDAVYGQIPNDTHLWYQGNNILLAPRATVGLGLNKADGSGEYDLPGGSIDFNNGTLSIGGIRTTPTTGIADDEFLAFDSSAVMYIRRMMPELRMFDSAELAEENKVMFRIEMRSTLAIFNDDAIVYGDLKGTGMGE